VVHCSDAWSALAERATRVCARCGASDAGARAAAAVGRLIRATEVSSAIEAGYTGANEDASIEPARSSDPAPLIEMLLRPDSRLQCAHALVGAPGGAAAARTRPAAS
jgi:hypothetical protein